MRTVHHLGIYDYVVIGLSLVVSFVIGVRFHFTGGKERTSRDFMLAGSNMSKLPVVLSIVVTYLSAIIMLGTPAEIYRYAGSQYMLIIPGLVIGMVLASYLLLPIYFNLGICTVYEYLEMRYGRLTRVLVSGFFVLQMMLYMSIVLNAPALALSAVTDLSTEASILLMGLVCIVYCTLGGLKAVLWTDVFQCGLMYVCVLLIFVSGIMEVGANEIIYKCKEGKRWELFNLDMDLTTRYTVWNALLRGLSWGFSGYGVNQLEVQRLLSVRTIKKAQSALLLSIVPLSILTFLCYSLGLILYGVFDQCDPVLNGAQTGLTKHDQLVPYFIVTRLGHIPGLTGLCIAGLFSGSLSTISSAVNSISTVTVVDFIQPYSSFLNFKDSHIVWMAKSLVFLYGFLCIGFTFLLSNVGSLTQMVTVSLGVVEGPVTAVFLLGILTTRTNQKGSVIGFLAGCLLSGWIGFGSTLSGYVYPSLPMSAENCPIIAPNLTEAEIASVTLFENLTSSETGTRQDQGYQSNIFFLHRISYMWIPTLGFLFTACMSYVTSILTCWNKKKKLDINYLCPVVKKWMVNSVFDDTNEVNMKEKYTMTSTDTIAQSIEPKTVSVCRLQK